MTKGDLINTLHRLAAQNLTIRLPDGREYMRACFIRADADALRALAEAGRVALLSDNGGRWVIAASLVSPWSGEPIEVNVNSLLEAIRDHR
jgi:hypothetical protein